MYRVPLPKSNFEDGALATCAFLTALVCCHLFSCGPVAESATAVFAAIQEAAEILTRESEAPSKQASRQRKSTLDDSLFPAGFTMSELNTVFTMRPKDRGSVGGGAGGLELLGSEAGSSNLRQLDFVLQARRFATWNRSNGTGSAHVKNRWEEVIQNKPSFWDRGPNLHFGPPGAQSLRAGLGGGCERAWEGRRATCADRRKTLWTLDLQRLGLTILGATPGRTFFLSCPI